MPTGITTTVQTRPAEAPAPPARPPARVGASLTPKMALVFSVAGGATMLSLASRSTARKQIGLKGLLLVTALGGLAGVAVGSIGLGMLRTRAEVERLREAAARDSRTIDLEQSTAPR